MLVPQESNKEARGPHSQGQFPQHTYTLVCSTHSDTCHVWLVFVALHQLARTNKQVQVRAFCTRNGVGDEAALTPWFLSEFCG